MTSYFVAVNDQQTGPFTLEQIKEQVKTGAIQKSTQMWREGLADWQAAEQVLAGTGVVFSVPPASRPPPPPNSATGGSDSGPAFGVPAAVVSAGRGMSWIGEGWDLFKLAPGYWILVLLIFLGVQIVLGLIPFIGSLASVLLGPSFIVGILAFSQGLAVEGKPNIDRLFVGFKEKLGTLIIVALLYFAMLMAAIMVVAFAVIALIGTAVFTDASGPAHGLEMLISSGGVLKVLLGLLLMMSLMMLVAAAYYYAPGLVYFANLSAVDAMKQSFAACLRNWLPFLLYGLVAIVIMFLGVLPFGLGLLVVLPVLFASYYTSFRDLFGRK